jgi:uncharacterized protein YjbJ (UPF0337 family)
MAQARDRTRDKTQQMKGKAKEVAGRATGDRDLRAKGTTDRKKSSAKQAGQKVKDTVRR